MTALTGYCAEWTLSQTEGNLDRVPPVGQTTSSFSLPASFMWLIHINHIPGLPYMLRRIVFRLHCMGNTEDNKGKIPIPFKMTIIKNREQSTLNLSCCQRCLQNMLAWPDLILLQFKCTTYLHYYVCLNINLRAQSNYNFESSWAAVGQ